MCGRYRLSRDEEKLIHELNKLLQEWEAARKWEFSHIRIRPRFNIAPTQQAPVIVQDAAGSWVGEEMSWGLVPAWSKDARGAAKCINARSETVADKPTFRTAFKKRRCLVPADGYYEWEKLPDGRKQPWQYSFKGGEPMLFAGLWESWKPRVAEGEPEMPDLHSFTILTTTPNEATAPIHDRMPVILPPQRWSTWLNPDTPPDELKSLLVPCDAAKIDTWKVSPKMNSSRYEAPDIITPLEEGTEFKLS